ncbi:hypothetical protein DesyoDRAFT_2321 [Desulfosporosinus youngiae DSM 17734]|uniref:Uncharacterized protein n=1 Tax=Desulfosporosinus youngiae DSM 17734 TaxID=768710 RepID=H5XUG6_9FIRM|nr:hypothetical protein DesyoDRAFT_2321 [Desulfosporosinus youngiae DSM 17734]
MGSLGSTALLASHFSESLNVIEYVRVLWLSQIGPRGPIWEDRGIRLSLFPRQPLIPLAQHQQEDTCGARHLEYTFLKEIIICRIYYLD